MTKRTELTVDLLILTHNRARHIDRLLDQVAGFRDRCQRLIVVDNASSDDTPEVLARHAEKMDMTIVRSEDNLGPPGGRNLAMTKSDADLLFFLDDDVELIGPEDPVTPVRDRFAADDGLAALSVKVINAAAGKVIGPEFPARDPDRNQDRDMKVSFFHECGMAMRRRAIDQIGDFDAGLFYAHEGLDWSFRAIERGWSIVHFPAVSVRHLKAPEGRLAQPDIVRRALLNRLVIAHKYLPLRYRLVGGFLWIIKTLIWGRSPRIVFDALGRYLAIRPALPQQTVSKPALRYMRQNHGRLWY